MTPEQVMDEGWQKNSVCASTLDTADRKTTDADPNIRANFEEVRDYWLMDFPNLNEKTRSIITLTFSMLVRPLITPPLRQIFSDQTTIQPEDTFNGKIIICDISTQEYRLVGRIANLVFKYTFQTAVLRRVQPADRQSFLRPVFLYSDEFHEFVSKFDASYQAVARSAGGCSVFITQNRESLRRALKNNDAVDSLLANLQLKLFFQNTGDTNEYASKLLGEHWLNITSTNVGQSQNDMAQQQQNNAGNHSSGVTRSQQRRYFVEPARFTTLLRGGAINNHKVEAILYNGGNLFGSGSDALPCRLITFNQIL
jgi:type IV secretory pathway TraG/TraD family ATPase VirD4